MKSIGKFVVGCLFAFSIYLLWALPIMWVYNHYIVLWVNTPLITYWYAVGVTFFIMAIQMMFSKLEAIHVDESTEENLQKLAQAIMKPFIVWGLAWIGFYFVR